MRQSSTPVNHALYTRPDEAETMTSIRAGETVMLDYAPIFQGDSASGRFNAVFDLAEMPRPLRNSAFVNAQLWFVPHAALPRYSGLDEYMHSYEGLPINALNDGPRTPPALHEVATGADAVTLAQSDFFKRLGIHIPAGSDIPIELVDSFNLVWNFRAAAHSSRIARREYVAESLANALKVAPAFWPKSPKMQSIVPDYEQALVVGSLDLDVVAGQIPVSGVASINGGNTGPLSINDTADGATTYDYYASGGKTGPDNDIIVKHDSGGLPQIFAEMAGQGINVTLADIEKARTTQAFAKLRQAYAGNDFSGFDNDDVIVANLMRGVSVDQSVWKRPMLLDSKIVTFAMRERFASDAANLDDSVTVGMAQLSLSCNLPTTPVNGVIIMTAEIVPERLYEAQYDPLFDIKDRSGYPDALRDIQRPEPVDLVKNSRIDARHTAPASLYGYEPMNSKHDRYFTRLGGSFYQADPLAPFKEQRAALWMSEIVDPAFNEDHYLCPVPFPHDVFADTTADCSEVAVRHQLSIRGMTIRGDVLQETNGDFAAVSEA